ncbi:FxSxx-COOH system tetratricopeptide repeat protein [Streptomyces sp. NPDC002730]|uniref:FxSxx-COOH system tetratricopeptide repeat protein n=1 Tax=Streptomyces sp. NPDC002730 TaxID=3364662 RepID=UPI0036863FEF
MCGSYATFLGRLGDSGRTLRRKSEKNDGRRAAHVPQRYAELAARLDVAQPGADADANARHAMQRLSTLNRWLIILDNAEDPEALEDCLPVGPGHVLITSRNPAWKRTVPGLRLDVFTRQDALDYLTGQLPALHPEQANALADALGDLPLALAQAAGVLTDGMPLTDYQQRLNANTAAFLAQGDTPGYPAPLAAAVTIATSQLSAHQPDPTPLLRLLSYLGPDPIPTKWLADARSRLTTIPGDADDLMWPQSALEPLARFGLAQVDHEAVQIHRLTQAIMRDQTSKDYTATIFDDLTTLLSAADPGDPEQPQTWPRWAKLTPHLTAARQTTGDHPHLRPALLRAAHYLVHSAQPRAAHDLAQALHQSWTDELGEDHPDTLRSAHSLAITLHELGELAEARRMDEDTLARRRRVLGENHPDTLESARKVRRAKRRWWPWTRRA